jgi:hypothetical protein
VGYEEIEASKTIAFERCVGTLMVAKYRQPGSGCLMCIKPRALALRREDPDTLFFTRRLVLEGDTELGLALKNALDAFSP